MFNEGGGGERIPDRPLPSTSVANHCSYPRMLLPGKRLWSLCLPATKDLVLHTVKSLPFLLKVPSRVLRFLGVKTYPCKDLQEILCLVSHKKDT